MKKLIIKISLILFLSVIAGCASGPKMHEVKSTFPEIGEDQGRIYFYRKSVFFGDAVQPEVYLNGEKIGRSIPDGFFFLDRPPGDYEVSTTTEVERDLSFQLHQGEEKYVRFNISVGVVAGRVLPVLIDRTQAIEELENLHYIEPVENQ